MNAPDHTAAKSDTLFLQKGKGVKLKKEYAGQGTRYSRGQTYK